MKFVCPVCKQDVVDENWRDIAIKDGTSVECPECHSISVININHVWISDIVIENKLKWTENFTPPTIKYPDDEHTKALLHFPKSASDLLDGNGEFLHMDSSDFEFGKTSSIHDGAPAEQSMQQTGFRLRLKNVFYKSYFFVRDVVRRTGRR